LHKKLAATLTISIFILSMFAVMVPAQAHFTLGSSSPVYPWTTNNFDPHVDGVIGYVWPGGGENTYLGAPTAVSNIVAPGYIAPYPTNSIAGSALAQTTYPANYLQVDAHEYAPFGAIVTGTTGDLIFAINATEASEGSYPLNFTEWDILLPPEFTFSQDTSNLVTTVTNNPYNAWTAGTLSAYDRYAPGWSLIRIVADPQHDINFTSTGEWYYARLNGVTAPTVAGKYFFKMFMAGGSSGPYWVPTENWPVLLVKGELDPAIITGTIRYGGYNASLYGNPIQQAGMVTAVMTEKLDPYTNQPIMGGTLTNAVAYFNGTDTTCLDTPADCGTNGTPEGSGGHYEIEGVAPGVYDLYASAAGYPQTLIASGVTVLKGQSLHFDGYLNPGPVIHGDVYSKHAFGSEPWPFNEYVKIELYANPTNNHVPDATAGPAVSWSPLPCVAGGQEYYGGGVDYSADKCGDPRVPGVTGTPTEFSTTYNPDTGIAFPWQDYTGGVGGVYTAAAGLYTDPQGVGPAQDWFVKIGQDSFHYEFGAKGEYGAPTDLDGHVPQVYATWVNGLAPGRYYARAWVFRYVQSALDGSTFQEYSFEVSSNEWAGDISLPLDLRISSWINKTVHFHDRAGTLSTDAINTGATKIEGALYDAVTGVMYAYNVTTIGQAANKLDPAGLNEYCNDWQHPEFGSCNIQLWGINGTWLGENYGIPAGTYKPTAYAMGYIQQTQDLVSVTLSGTPIQISNHLYRGVGFNFTVYSIDWERPRVNRNWVWPGNEIDIAMFDANLTFVDSYSNWNTGETFLYQNSTYYAEALGTGLRVQTGPGTYDDAYGVWFGHPESSHALPGGRMYGSSIFITSSATNTWGLKWYTYVGFDSGQYSFQGWTYGYIQDKDFTVYANKGEIADIKINLIIGVNVTVDILFKTEGLIAGTPYDMSARVRVFDDSGNLVGEWMSSEGVYLTAPGNAQGADFTAAYPGAGGYNFLPDGTTNLRVNIAGLPFNQTGYGDPVFTPYGCDFAFDCYSPGYWSTPGALWPNEGILGQPDYTGTGWTVEVDFVNWYYSGVPSVYSETQVGAAPLPLASPADWHTWYPVVPGLLMGESYHIVPGTTATSGISLTEDGALNTAFLGHSMAMNHLGPYSQQAVWSLPNAHLSGEVSGVWEVDLNGYVTGTALAFTWSNEFRSISWYPVVVTGATGAMQGQSFTSYTNDGLYEFYLAPGTYSMTLSGPGYPETSMGSIAVTAGQTGTPYSGNNIGLPPTNIPVPEFSGLAIVAFSALAASLYLLRRKRR
jgi:hypothetical protein